MTDRAKWTAGTAVGVALGAGYAASPVTVWCLAIIAGLFAWGVHDLPERERRWVLSALAVALALRLMAVAGLFLAADHHLAPDRGPLISFFWDGDGLWIKRRAMLIRNEWLGESIQPFRFAAVFDVGYGWTAYLYLIAYIQYWLGPAPYAIHLVNVALFFATSLILFKVARSAFGPVPAVVGLLVTIFLPNLFLWSVAAMKESAYVCLLALGLAGGAAILRGGAEVLSGSRVTGWMRIAGGIVAGGFAAGVIDSIRTGGAVILVVGLVIGVIGHAVGRCRPLAVAALVVLPLGVWGAWRTPAIQSRVTARMTASVTQHVGHTMTDGHFYRLLDQSMYYAGDWYAHLPRDLSMPSDALARYAIRAVTFFVVMPLPWTNRSLSEAAFLPMQIIWYLFVALAPIGLVAGMRRGTPVAWLLAGFAIAGTLAIAPNAGNIGTMVRHRDTVVPFVIWLSALGGVHAFSAIVSRRARRSSDSRTSPFEAAHAAH